jgi:hypothetical protein
VELLRNSPGIPCGTKKYTNGIQINTLCEQFENQQKEFISKSNSNGRIEK